MRCRACCNNETATRAHPLVLLSGATTETALMTVATAVDEGDP
jgi:hypothetical protein